MRSRGEELVIREELPSYGPGIIANVGGGESALGGKYKILSKTVKARDIFTNGDSIHEWGYDPQPRAK